MVRGARWFSFALAKTWPRLALDLAKWQAFVLNKHACTCRVFAFDCVRSAAKFVQRFSLGGFCFRKGTWSFILWPSDDNPVPKIHNPRRMIFVPISYLNNLPVRARFQSAEARVSFLRSSAQLAPDGIWNSDGKLTHDFFFYVGFFFNGPDFSLQSTGGVRQG